MHCFLHLLVCVCSEKKSDLLTVEYVGADCRNVEGIGEKFRLTLRQMISDVLTKMYQCHIPQQSLSGIPRLRRNEDQREPPRGARNVLSSNWRAQPMGEISRDRHPERIQRRLRPPRARLTPRGYGSRVSKPLGT